MPDPIEQHQQFEWDTMVDAIIDLMPVKLAPAEWRELRDKIDKSLWAHVGDLFGSSTIEFRQRENASEIRLWMSVGPDCVDFQKGFPTEAVAAKAFRQKDLSLAAGVLAARMAEMDRENAA